MPDDQSRGPLRTARLPRVAVALLMSAAGCSGARGGTSLHAVTRDVNGCAATLPLARASVSDRAVLVEIHPISASTARRIQRAAGGTSLSVEQQRKHLCVVAYRGAFRRQQVPLATTSHGQYVVLVITARHPEVLAAALVDQLPHGV